MRRSKGQVTILLGLGLLAAVVVGGAFMIGDLQSLLELIIDNWTILFASVLGIGVTGTFVINSYQKKPHWKKDVAGLGALVGILLAIPFVWASAPHPEATYDADCRISAINPVFQYSKINDIEVSNFQKRGPLSVMRPENMELSITDKMKIEYAVFCDGDKVDDGGFGISLIEGQPIGKSKTQVIEGLPGGGNCEVRVDLIHSGGKQIDEETYIFRVPKG